MAADKGLVSREMNTSVGMLGRWETHAVIKKWDSALIGPNNVIGLLLLYIHVRYSLSQGWWA